MFRKMGKSERGQVLIIVVIGFVVLMGFVGLAIDGGRVFSDRRNAQNIADAASLAGGGKAALSLENSHVFLSTWSCTDVRVKNAMTAAVTAAIKRASSNGFTIVNSTEVPDRVEVECGTHKDAKTGRVDKYLDVKVYLTTTTETIFASFVFNEGLTSSVEAVTRVRPTSPLAFGNAVVALNPANCQGQTNGAGFHGSVDVIVNGGGIFSNGCLRADGGPEVKVNDGGVFHVGEVRDGDKFDPAATPVEQGIPPEAYNVPLPDCTHADAHKVNGSSLPNEMDSGLWCITGDVKWNAHDVIKGEEVTLYFINGKLTINGGATVYLTAPPANPDPDPAIPGILIYSDPSNHNDIQINGNSTSRFEGTILAPGGNVDLLGNGATDCYISQVIAWNVEVGGNADANVTFQEEKMYKKPSSIELFK